MIQLPRTRRGTKPHAEAVAKARALVTERVSHWSAVYGIPYGKISIRKQKTRWGSCSRAGNLSFNYRLGFLPLSLADYVIVHELCHIVQHDHSPAFWALMEKVIPSPKKLRTQLHAYRF